jgi:DNA ligase-1
MADGHSLIDEPYAKRWEALTRVTGGRHLAERRLVTTPEAAREFQAMALSAGHEGLVAKDLRSTYEPGGRGKRWFKLKTAETVDGDDDAVDRGSGGVSGFRTTIWPFATEKPSRTSARRSKDSPTGSSSR